MQKEDKNEEENIAIIVYTKVNYNYVINYHYKANVYTGSQKKLNDPQVQFTGAIPTSSTDYSAQIRAIQNAQKEITEAQADYDTNLANYKTKLSEASKLQNYADSSLNSNVLNHTIDDASGNYTLTLQDKTKEGYPLYTAADGTKIYKNGSRCAIMVWSNTTFCWRITRQTKSYSSIQVVCNRCSRPFRCSKKRV